MVFVYITCFVFSPQDEKKALKKVQEDDDALLSKSSLNIPLVKETEEDVKLAGLMRLRAVESMSLFLYARRVILCYTPGCPSVRPSVCLSVR